MLKQSREEINNRYQQSSLSGYLVTGRSAANSRTARNSLSPQKLKLNQSIDNFQDLHNSIEFSERKPSIGEEKKESALHEDNATANMKLNLPKTKSLSKLHERKASLHTLGFGSELHTSYDDIGIEKRAIPQKKWGHENQNLYDNLPEIHSHLNRVT